MSELSATIDIVGADEKIKVVIITGTEKDPFVQEQTSGM